MFLTIETTSCAGTDTEVNYLEHVQAVITVNTTRFEMDRFVDVNFFLELIETIELTFISGYFSNEHLVIVHLVKQN